MFKDFFEHVFGFKLKYNIQTNGYIGHYNLKVSYVLFPPADK